MNTLKEVQQEFKNRNYHRDAKCCRTCQHARIWRYSISIWTDEDNFRYCNDMWLLAVDLVPQDVEVDDEGICDKWEG